MFSFLKSNLSKLVTATQHSGCMYTVAFSSLCLLSQLSSLMGVGLSASTFDSILKIDVNSLHWLQRPSRVVTSLHWTLLGRPEEEPALRRVSFTQMQASCRLFLDMTSRTCWAVWSGRLMLGRILLASYSRQVALRAVWNFWHSPVVLSLLRHEQFTPRLWARRHFYTDKGERDEGDC